MPVLRKLSTEEACMLATKPLGERASIAATYDAYLVDFVVEDYGGVEIDATDNRQTVRNRLQAAAARRGFALTFRRTTGPTLQFQIGAVLADATEADASTQSVTSTVEDSVPVVPPSNTAAALVPTSSPTATAPKRRGRPPRAVDADVVTAAPAVPAARRRGRPPRQQA